MIAEVFGARPVCPLTDDDSWRGVRRRRRINAPTGNQRMRAMRKLPVVPICRSGCILLFRNMLDSDPKQKHHPPVSRLHEGRFAIVTDVERGMRWTRWHRGALCA